MNSEQWDWQMYAACRGLNVETFFTGENERGPAKRERESAAKQVCARCPVVESCLAWALWVQEPYGVWGGKSADERNAMRRRGALDIA